MDYEPIELEEALKLLSKGIPVYYPSQYGTVLMLEIDPEHCPQDSSWLEIAHFLIYEALYKKKKGVKHE